MSRYRAFGKTEIPRYIPGGTVARIVSEKKARENEIEREKRKTKGPRTIFLDLLLKYLNEGKTKEEAIENFLTLYNGIYSKMDVEAWIMQEEKKNTKGRDDDER